MVEQWSSKPYAWVRFLLPLEHVNLNRSNNVLDVQAPSYFNTQKHKKKFLELKRLLWVKNSTIPHQKIYFRLKSLTPVTTSPLSKKFYSLKTLYHKHSHFWASQLHIFGSIPARLTEFVNPQYRLHFARWAHMASHSESARVTWKVTQSSFPTLPPLFQTLTQFFKNSSSKQHNHNLNVNEYYGKLQTKKTQKLVTWAQKRFKLLQLNFRQHRQSGKSVSPPITLSIPQLHVFGERPITPVMFSQGSVQSSSNFRSTGIHHSLDSTKLMLKYFHMNNHSQTFNGVTRVYPAKIYTNLLPCHQLTLRKTLKNFQNRSKTQFHSAFLVWYNFLIIRFLENFTGHKTCITFNPCLAKSLTFSEKAQLLLWTQRIRGFQRTIGPKVSLLESLELTYLSLKLKDPTLLSNWLIRTIRKVSFWKYKAFFRFLKFLFNNLLLLIFKPLGVLGVKIKLKGKISVAGNARTRAIYYRIGNTSHAKIQNKILHTLNLVHTFTGVLGLQIWYYF